MTRQARVVVPFFDLAPHLVACTDLIFTTARHFAEHYAQTLPVVVLPAPFDFPRMRFYQLWHERSRHSASHRWFRGMLGDVAKRLA